MGDSKTIEEGEGSREAGTVTWYSKSFGRRYTELYAHRDQSEAGSDIEKVLRLLQLTDGLPILDLACGTGRHSLELAARGFEVVGLDLSEELLEIAIASAAEKGLSIRFIRGDMRAIPFESAFGCVLNFFTSFGYFIDEEDNLAVLAAIRRSLVPGGSFLIDHLNRERVRDNLVPVDSRNEGGRKITQRRRFIEESGRVEKTITVEDGVSRESYVESVRLYTREEFCDLVDRAGMRVVGVYGGLDGSEFGSASERMVVVGGRPDDPL